MPLYEYHCDACGQRFEVIRKFSDPELETCAKCGKGPIQRLVSSPAIQFKGTGWYITDYSSKGKAGSEASSSTSSSGDSKAPATASSEGTSTKTETPAAASATKTGSTDS